MKHYKCFIRMIDCLDDEVPMFTRAVWGLCVLAPYVAVYLLYGFIYAMIGFLGTLVCMFMVYGASIILASILIFFHDYGDTIKHQCRTLPTAFKKCWECRRG